MFEDVVPGELAFPEWQNLEPPRPPIRHAQRDGRGHRWAGLIITGCLPRTGCTELVGKELTSDQPGLFKKTKRTFQSS